MRIHLGLVFTQVPLALISKIYIDTVEVVQLLIVDLNQIRDVKLLIEWELLPLHDPRMVH